MYHISGILSTNGADGYSGVGGASGGSILIRCHGFYGSGLVQSLGGGGIAL